MSSDTLKPSEGSTAPIMSTSPENGIQVPGTPNKRVPTFDAKEKIEDFDWQDLEMNFNKDMDRCNKEEKKLYEELNSLMSVKPHLFVLLLPPVLTFRSTSQYGPNLCTLMSRNGLPRG